MSRISRSSGATVESASGQLDPSFGKNGYTIPPFGRLVSSGMTVAVLPDGSLIAGGGVLSDSDGTFLLCRCQPDGSLDPRFGHDGLVLTPMPAAMGAGGIQDLAIQADGRILAIGSAGLPSGQLGVAAARYLPTGALDGTFGDGGTLVCEIVPAGAAATALWLLKDGRFLVAGGADDDDGAADFLCARFLPNGRLDPSFGRGGYTLVEPPGGDSLGEALAILPDGRVILAGTSVDDNGNHLTLACLSPDGALDPRFGQDGIARGQTTPGQGRGGGNAVAIGAPGTILAAGLGEADGVTGFALMRFTAAGTPDPSFGGSGQVFTRFEGVSAASGVTIRPDGRIVACGTAGAQALAIALAGYRPTGELDPTFGVGGTTTTPIGQQSSASALALQPDGRIVVIGATGTANLTASDLVIARYL